MKLPFLGARKGGKSRARGGGSRAAAAAQPSFRARSAFLLAGLGLAASGLVYRAVDLQLVDHAFLQGQGNQRFMRVAEVAAHRGTITDRYGEPLAVSTPVDSIWVNPKELALAADQIPRLAKALKRDKNELARRVTSNLDRSFLYLVRHMQPAEAAKVKALSAAAPAERNSAAPGKQANIASGRSSPGTRRQFSAPRTKPRLRECEPNSSSTC